MGRAQLSRDKVLQAAVALVDERGLDALSMRALGERLGVEAMSLYRYVQGKQDLLNGVHAALLDELERPPARGPWPQRVRRLALSFRAVLARHPRALPLFATRPAVAPGSLRAVEDALAILAEAGFDPAERLHVFHSLTALVIGLSLFHLGFEDAAYQGYTLDEATFPLLSSTLAKTPWNRDRELTFALDAHLAGLEARLAAKRRR